MVRVGFIGLGIMGRPMAANLQRSGVSLSVWNRSSEAATALAALGATVTRSPAEVFEASDIVFVMLASQDAVDTVLRRGTASFGEMVGGHVVVQLGTTSPGFSAALGGDVEAAGGRYVEAPVSGSRVPAERGELVGLVAGAPGDVEVVVPLLERMCREVVRCGQVPSATGTKLAVNLYLCTMVAALAEAYHLAAGLGLDLAVLQRALDCGPMASPVSVLKLAKLVERDFTVQAAVTDVHTNTRLIADAARSAEVDTPLLDVARALFRETEQSGRGALDMAAVVTALELRDGTATGATGSSGPVSATGCGSG